MFQRKALLIERLNIPEETSEEILPALGGLTLTECEWSLRITQARDKSATRVGVATTRKKVFPPKPGLEQVDTESQLYICPKNLNAWITKEMPFFLMEKDHRLRPKGILMDGPPGTGKTAGAKEIARQLGVPLFRFDQAAVKSKWVGESEANLKRTLQAAAHEAPCVLLLDEVEKMFNTGFMDGTGVTQNLLGDFLWFLQENESRVLTVMTTNNAKAIPAPLTRPGRIDCTMQFLGLGPEELSPFMTAIFKSYDMEPGEALSKLVGTMAEKAMTDSKKIPQATAEQAVIQLIKNLKMDSHTAETCKPIFQKPKLKLSTSTN